MQLRDREIADRRRPRPGRQARRGAAVDPAIVGLDQRSRGVEGQRPRVRMGCGIVRGAAVGQRDPTRCGRQRRVAPEQPAAVVVGADRIREEEVASDHAFAEGGLAVAADVDDVGVGRIGRDREVDVALAARMDPELDSVLLGGNRYPECCPGGAVRRSEHLGEASVRSDHADEQLARGAGRDPGALRARARIEHGIDGGIGDLGPGRAAVGASPDPTRAGDQRRVERRRRAGHALEVADGAVRQSRTGGTRDQREGPAGVHRAMDAAARAGDDGRPARDESGDADRRQRAGRIEDSPGRPAVGRADDAEQPAAVAAIGGHAAGPGDQGLVGGIGRVEGERAERGGCERRSDLGPGRAGGGGVGGAPQTPVDGGDQQDARVGGMWGDRFDGATHGAIGDPLDLALLRGGRSPLNPGATHRLGCQQRR